MFALAAKKRAEEAEAKRAAGGGEEGEPGEIDEHVKRGMTKGRMGGQAQIKLVMQIKQNVDKQLQKQEIIARMSQHIQNIVLQKSEMKQIIEETDAILSADILQLRAEKKFIYRFCLEIEQSKWFLFLISASIILNTFVLALDQFPTDVDRLIFIEWANLMFYCVFFVEMIIKFLGLGFKIYFKDTANVFDFIVVVISTIDLAL